jgi:hypothetical protein
LNTILLDPSTWDLILDASGNIAMAQEPYSISQDVASAIKLFAGELYYDTAQGIPYFDQILGQRPDLSYMQSQFEAAALTVPDVVSAKATISFYKDRSIGGQVLVIDTTGQSHNVTFP